MSRIRFFQSFLIGSQRIHRINETRGQTIAGKPRRIFDRILQNGHKPTNLVRYSARMPKSDRAFRALSRAQPDVTAALLRVLTPSLMPPNVQLVPDDVAPTHLDGLPPELDADWAVRVAQDDLLHVECQGYKDAGFAERTLWYHLGFALRNRGKRRVRTVALWLKPLPAGQPRMRRISIRKTRSSSAFVTPPCERTAFIRRRVRTQRYTQDTRIV